MRTDCFEIGVIQAFLDGETASETTARIANHIAECADCAKLLAEAEDQNAMVFSLLDREMDVMVPTNRLWNRINESIGEIRHSVSIFGRIRALAGFYPVNPALASALSLLVVFGVIAVVWSMRQGNGGTETASSRISGVDKGKVLRQIAPAPVISQNTEIKDGRDGLNSGESEQALPTFDKNATVARGGETGRSGASLAVYRTPPARSAYLPGEKVYLNTIAELNEEFEANKDRVLPPSARVAFERDLAVVDDAIRKMRDVVRKNPDNQSARQVLYASYQDKIDLLNSVALRDELLAAR